VQIFDGETTVLPVNMEAAPPGLSGADQEFIIPPSTLITQSEWEQNGPPEEQRRARMLREVIIPTYIVVHLGSPSNTEAENLRVNFTDYIKNVASHELYPTWPDAALRANIYCQISFAINRVYTEWYPSQGYNFNITNSTAYDQYFVKGGNVFDNISKIVDEIFNQYIRRTGHMEPFFSAFCNGTTVRCPGLSQWGTVPLAEQGRAPIEILKSFYPNDIQIVTSNNIQNIPQSYPGNPLNTGASGADVKKMQDNLNRIRVNYPLIPVISKPDGKFGAQTAEAVRVFQSVFDLTPDGVIGKSTWYKISSVYNAVANLGELDSEGELIGLGAAPPGVVLREGDRGRDVVSLQYILNFIAEFYANVPAVLRNSLFDIATRDSVLAFQKNFNLAQDGVVGPSTWAALYQVYRSVEASVPKMPPAPGLQPAYPGAPLRMGSRGENVVLLQTFLSAIAGYYPSIPKPAVDGVFGGVTQSAVIAFQRLFALAADGIVGPATWNKITEVYSSDSAGQAPPAPGAPYPGAPLRVGSQGANVRILQQYINAIADAYPSIPKVTVDGVFGSGTQAAVLAFQRLFALTPDGIAGPRTWDGLVYQYGRAASGRAATMAVAQAMSGVMLGRMLLKV
jgi:peptidoglycan hydrolase-like protein with peptidoglycan-binding domain